ncbi:MAG: hypothetical protein V2A76_02405 [Planctomycetota bacterium]
MMIRRTPCTLFLISVLGLSASAQIVPGPDAAIFVLNGSGTTASGSSGTVLANLGPTDVVSFQPVFTFSCEKILTNVTIDTILGDHDADGVFAENFIGSFDAIDILKVPAPPLEIRNVFSFVFSTSESFGGVSKGSVFRFVPGASGGDFVQSVLLESQILSAVGQTSGVDALDTNAFTQDVAGNIYLSFADDEMVNGTLVGDGGVVMIPAAAMTFAGSGVVLTVTSGSAVLLLNEADVDAMVANTGLTTSSTIGDLTCLAIDANAQTFIGLDGQPHPNLYFSGESLGPVVLTTKNNGEFATTGSGPPLGAAVPNLGHFGLGSMSGGIGALTVQPETGRALVTDVVDGEVNYPSENWVEFDIGNCTPGQSIALFFSLQPAIPGYQPIGSTIHGRWFPQFYAVPTYGVAQVPADFNGVAVIGGPLGHPLSGWILLAQPYDFGSTLFGLPAQLGAPSMIHFP